MTGNSFTFVPTPTNCDVCGVALDKQMYDCAVNGGAWGCICPSCFQLENCALGKGRGQRYEREADGLFWYREGL